MNTRMKLILWLVAFMLGAAIIFAWNVIPTFAAEANVTWTYSIEEEDKILGYRIYESPDTPHVQHIDPAQRTSVVTADECTTFYMVAYDAYSESGHSNSLVYCPGKLMVPGDFVRVIKYTVFRQGDGPLVAFKKRWSER